MQVRICREKSTGQVYAMKKLKRGVGYVHGNRMKVIDRVSLGRDGMLAVVSVGGKLILIGVSGQHIEKISDEARDLLNGLLNKNPKKRITIEEILNHPWLNDFNDKKKFKKCKKKKY